MKKTINILTVIIAIFSGFSVLFTVMGLTIFWEPLCLLESSSLEVVREGPMFFMGDVITTSGQFLVIMVILTTFKTRRFIAIEIVSILFLVLFFPLLSFFLAEISNASMETIDYISSMRYSVTNEVLFLPRAFHRFSYTLCLVLSGMRISTKFHLNKQIKKHMTFNQKNIRD